ncbi:hypothetical protein NKI91_33135, partial [Mesorhizobium sp. M0312]
SPLIKYSLTGAADEASASKPAPSRASGLVHWRNVLVLADETNGNFRPISAIGGSLLIEFCT